MSRLPYVNPADAPAPVREALQAALPLSFFRVMAHAETAFPDWMRWGGTLLKGLALDPLLREIAILRVAQLSDVTYEWAQHEPIARSVGATDEMIHALGRDEIGDDCFTSDQQIVLRFTTEVVRDVRPPDDTTAALTGLLSPREVVELLMVIGQYMMIARVAAVTDLEVDKPMGAAVYGARP
ncbi:4-carboxymuconolactone decarboxylase [Micromonospora noduli]|uniref:4-carboxymuconolactone decarboxylase n=2 Tax=Micromonospora noduli TaxID=709876 RepID=A0A328N7P7_9ACTN|nr:4-carboxymuconolactone decarboxylase [Micromonospora noduli]RAO08167.1 4-carboxymuconolactone decarboxylase [Micromonospora noduli]RAO20764.1 4-carboxymuconolactone decarboxylase [Micromonospora noduli]RAO27578.1 4-carboxymuconolactone decarboxylase [Micromonospora noduli]RAO32894.1 4-carboxymuconolactone decarboxylase [Micromonospora noduli]